MVAAQLHLETGIVLDSGVIEEWPEHGLLRGHLQVHEGVVQVGAVEDAVATPPHVLHVELGVRLVEVAHISTDQLRQQTCVAALLLCNRPGHCLELKHFTLHLLIHCIHTCCNDSMNPTQSLYMLQ